MGAFLFLMVRILLPIINAVIFLELFIIKKKSIYLWIFIVFISLYIGNSLWLVDVLFPEIAYFRRLGSKYSVYVAFIKEACTLARFFSYYKFGDILIGRPMPKHEKVVWSILFIVILTTVFTKASINDYIWNYGVLLAYTAIIWVVLTYGLIRIIKNHCEYDKVDFNTLVFLYCSTLLCYSSSFFLSILHDLGVVSTNGGGFIIAANLILCFAGLGWVILKAYQCKAFEKVDEKEFIEPVDAVSGECSTRISDHYELLEQFQKNFSILKIDL